MVRKQPETGGHMDALERIEAVTDHAESVRSYRDATTALIFKKGQDLIDSAAIYEEGGRTERAYINYTEFLSLFLDKLHQYREMSTAEKSIIEFYCNEIVPQVETLKKQLLKQYAREHEEYLSLVEKIRKQAAKQHQQELDEQDRLENEAGLPGTSGGSPQLSCRSLSSPHPSSSYVERASTGTFLPDAFGVATSQAGSPLSGSYVYEDTLALYKSGGEDQFPSPSAPPADLDLMDEAVDTTFLDMDGNTSPKQFWTPPATAIRPVMVPEGLVSTFLEYVKYNTKANKETCGFLTGKINDDELIITSLIIPKQEGTADTCNVLDDLEIFSLQDQLGLVTCGWIHTHPSQTAFLSSVDLHTHFSYQAMLPEAIAIVCSPKMDQVGTFSLTPAGMAEIGSCREQGFHPHSTSGLFEEAHHSIVDPSIKLTVHDLRCDFIEID